jgi:excinuclease ABC subunit B
LTKNSVSASYYEKEQRKNNENEISNLTIPQIEKKIRDKRKLMESAAKDLDFIMAAKFRDEIIAYKKRLENLKR